MFVSQALLVLGVLGYLYIINTYTDMSYYGLFIFAPFVAYSMYIGNIKIVSGEVPVGYRIVVIATLALYFIVSFLTGFWAITWLIILAIPVYSIIREVKGNERIISIMPFISVTIFMLLGFFFGWWAFAWMAFLLIPVVAILKSN
jgi:hypothetical protein